MAIFRPSALIGDISGALGSVIFYSGARSGVLGSRPNFSPPLTRDAGSRQNALVSILHLWVAQSDEFKATWNSFAGHFGWINRLKLRRPLSGYQAFLSFHLQQWPYAGFGLVALPPPQLLSLPTPTITAAHFTWYGAQTITVSVLPPAGTQEWLIVRRGRGFGPRTSPGMTQLGGRWWRAHLTEDWQTQIRVQGITFEPGELIELTIYWVLPTYWPSARASIQTTVV